MSKLLMLLRHAEAVDRSFSDSDRSRELTSKGIAQSHQIGLFLSENLFTPDAIFTSAAVRASHTATLVGDAMKAEQPIAEDELYDASVRTFFNFICNLDDEHEKVLCVGHNPTISYLAEYLTKQIIGDMSTAGVAIIRFNVRTWKEVSEGNGELLRYVDERTITNA